MVDLDSLTATLDAAAVGYLGDPLLYKIGNAAAVSIRGFVDDMEQIEGFGSSSAVAREPEFQVREADVPNRPTDADRITIVKTGQVYAPTGAHRVSSGGWWAFRGKPVT